MIRRLKSLCWTRLKRIVARSPGIRRRLEFLLERGDEPFFANGHFYSPVVDLQDARASADRLWPPAPADTPGLALSPAQHAAFLDEVVRPRVESFGQLCAAQCADDPLRFPVDNDQFGTMDSLVLHAMIDHARPRRIVEIGSGFSTLLMRATRRALADGAIAIDCIEPYPRAFLRADAMGVGLHDIPVQSAPSSLFTSLEAGDLLFVDSSHVSKTGSDVNHIFFEILPRLAPGVIVHVHDIFLPFEYPKDWVIDQRRSWNEQYLLRALLMDSRRYRPLFGAAFAAHACPDAVAAIATALAARDIDPQGMAGSSFWMRIESG